MDLHPIEKAREIFEKAEIPFCLMASTLLGIYRDGEPLGPIFEFAVLASDMTPEKVKKLESLVSVRCKRQSESGLAIIDLGGISPENANFETHLVFFKNGYSYHNLAGDSVLVWPKEMWEKKNWGKIKWKDKEWNTPQKIEPYLAMYYGLDWKTPQPFGWGNAPNHYHLDDIKDKKLWFDELTVYKS